jgi:hypothetical protein
MSKKSGTKKTNEPQITWSDMVDDTSDLSVNPDFPPLSGSASSPQPAAVTSPAPIPTLTLQEAIRELGESLIAYAEHMIDGGVVEYKEVPINVLATAQAGVALNKITPFNCKKVGEIIDKIRGYERVMACIPLEDVIQEANKKIAEIDASIKELDHEMEILEEQDGDEAAVESLKLIKKRGALRKEKTTATIKVYPSTASIVRAPAPQARPRPVVATRDYRTEQFAVAQDSRKAYLCDFICLGNINTIPQFLESHPTIRSFGIIFFKVPSSKKDYIYFGSNRNGQPIVVEFDISTFRGFGDGLGLSKKDGQTAVYSLPSPRCAFKTATPDGHFKAATALVRDVFNERNVTEYSIPNPKYCDVAHKGNEFKCTMIHNTKKDTNIYVTFDKLWLVKATNGFNRASAYMEYFGDEYEYKDKVSKLRAIGDIGDIVECARDRYESESKQIENFMPPFVMANLVLCAILGRHPQITEHDMTA